MLVLAPESVEFEGESWPAVELISIDRTPKREVVEVGDLGIPPPSGWRLSLASIRASGRLLS